jgi:hypothetical protein
MHTKLLIRPMNFQIRYQQWVDTLMFSHLDMLRGSYANEVFGNGAEDLKFIVQQAQSKIIWQPEILQTSDISCIIDYFKTILLNHKYYSYISDERQDVFDSGVKMNVHRHYLKPNIDADELLNNSQTHLFGNIFLEHHFNNNNNSLIITVNYYSQKKYESFEKLMELLLS